MKEIYLAGGCFWGLQGYFDLLQGVIFSEVGYANSSLKNPSYELVCQGTTNAAEALWIQYDPVLLSLEDILWRFFAVVDPTALNYQGNDRGSQYRNGIYVVDQTELAFINEFIQTYIAPQHKKPIVTEVLMLENYFKAEEYHQKYLQKNPHGYCHIPLGEALKPLKKSFPKY